MQKISNYMWLILATLMFSNRVVFAFDMMLNLEEISSSYKHIKIVKIIKENEMNKVEIISDENFELFNCPVASNCMNEGTVISSLILPKIAPEKKLYFDSLNYAIEHFNKSLKRRNISSDNITYLKSWYENESLLFSASEEISLKIWFKFKFNLAGKERSLFYMCHEHSAGETDCHVYRNITGELKW